MGPTWAFDFASMTPTCAVDDPTLPNCIARPQQPGETPPVLVYKRSPMWGGGDGDQPGQLTLTLTLTLILTLILTLTLTLTPTLTR